MKCIIVGDIAIPAVRIQEFFKRLEKYGLQIVSMDWQAGISRQAFVEKIKNLEENGPEAEQPPPELLEEVKDASFLVVHFAPVTAGVIEAGKELKIVGCLRGGFENVDVNKSTEKGILVLHSPGRNADAVADCTFGLLLAEVRNIARASDSLRKGMWGGGFKKFFGSDLPGKTFGIVGFGNVGKKVAKRAAGFGMKILVYDPYVSEESVRRYGGELVELETLLRASDFVSIHARLCEETRGLIAAGEIALMKSTAYLVNTARGGIVDEEALYNALKDSRIAGAALDVFEREPLDPNSPLLKLENVTLTPHIAGSTREAILNAPRMMATDIERFLNGEKPRFVVNDAVLKSLNFQSGT